MPLSVGVFMGYSVFIKMYMRVGMMMLLAMCMALMAGAPEKSTDLMRCEIRYDFQSGLKFVSDALQMMRLHHAEHYLLVDCQRDIHFRAFHNGRPVLVAYGMSELYAASDYRVMVFIGKSTHVDYENRIQLDAEHGRFSRGLVVGHHIAVDDLRLALQSYRVFLSARPFAEKTAFLRCPLVEKYIIDICFFKLLFPFRIFIYIPENLCIYFHISFS